MDLTLVQDDWNIKTPQSTWAPSYGAISSRAKESRAFIWEKIQQLQEDGQGSPEILFVAHGGYLNYFTEYWEDSGVDRGKLFILCYK